MMKNDPIVETAKRVIRIERDALTQLVENLDYQFSEAVQILAAVRGRVVVGGIGKSGHIGKKIAATLASTGTPALFVHPAEAIHGDLGMITGEDALIVISNSGETSELSGLITYAARFNVPIVAITRNPDSTLGRAAHCTLSLPQAPEACAIGMAPTTSTTATLALGDALAVALMELREFRAEDFHVFHPGGKLGAQLLRVQDLMHTGPELPLVHTETPMSEVLITMTRCGFGVVGVVEADKPRVLGVISDGDLRRHMAGLLKKRAGEVMTPTPLSTTAATLAVEALAVMSRRKITCLLVTDSNHLVIGLIHIHDCLRAGIDSVTTK